MRGRETGVGIGFDDDEGGRDDGWSVFFSLSTCQFVLGQLGNLIDRGLVAICGDHFMACLLG